MNESFKKMPVAFVFLFLACCEGYNILVPIPIAVKSEALFMSQIAYKLADAGHRVTFINGFKVPPKHKNLTIIQIPELEELWQNSSDLSSNTDKVELTTSELYSFIGIMFKIANEIAWGNPQVMEVWKTRNEFDLLLTLSMYHEGIFPFLMDNKMPMVQVISMGFEHLSISREGNWITPAILPSMFSSFQENMGFWERLQNLANTIFLHYLARKTSHTYTEPVIELFPQIEDITR